LIYFTGALERFPQKWMPVFRFKPLQGENPGNSR
jgi:hypothetical protein